MAENDRNQCPSYWATDPDTWRMWVNVLGPAAASKLAGACMSYFFDGTEPDAFRLTKQARAMFEGERAKLDRRRTNALNGAKRGRKSTAKDGGHQPERNVENSEDRGESAKKSQGDARATSRQSKRNRTRPHSSTCGNGKSGFKAITNRNRNTNPQTPTPSESARGSGAVSVEEFAALADSIGYGPNAYGMTDGTMTVAGG